MVVILLLEKSLQKKQVRMSNSDHFVWKLGQVKKKDVSRPHPLHFLAPPLFYYYFLWATFFNIKKVFL